MQRTFQLLLAAAAIILGTLWLIHWQRVRTLNSGDVHMRQGPVLRQPAGQSPAPKSPAQTASVTPAPLSEEAVLAPPRIHSRPLPPQQPESLAALPVTHPVHRILPGRVVAAGAGKFQLYRQGDLTYRLNTETGDACVLFATQEMWSNPLVYDNGCANHN